MGNVSAAGFRNHKYTNEQQKIKEALCKVAPFCFLRKEARERLATVSELRLYKNGMYICGTMGASVDFSVEKGWEDDGRTFIVVEGEVTAKLDGDLRERIAKDSMFGIDFAVLERRRNVTRVADGECTVVAIPADAVLHAVKETIAIEARISVIRTFTEKVSIGEHLSAFKTAVREGVNCGRIALPEILERYKRINPVIHPHMLDDSKLDTKAWTYAIRRLPDPLTTTHAFLITTQLPEILTVGATELKDNSRRTRTRTSYRLRDGKVAIIIRHFEADVLDFMCNLCIHCIEAQKLRSMLNDPKWLRLLKSGSDLESGSNVQSGSNVGDITPLSNYLVDLKEMWGDQVCTRILEVIHHEEKYLFDLRKPSLIKPDPSERWTRRLWQEARNVLEFGDIIMAPGDIRGGSDLVVDVVQGSTRVTKNMLAAPHIYSERDGILRWVEKEKPERKKKIESIYAEPDRLYAETGTLYAETDKLYAYAYWYHKVKNIKKDLPPGVVELDLEQTEDTGVKVMLVNVNRILQQENSTSRMDPALSDMRAAAKHHLIVNIGYPIGAQSANIMRCLILLFGKNIRSINIIGKAGGIKDGMKMDEILIASDVVNDDPYGIVAQLSPSPNDVDTINSFLRPPVKGRMLTTAGTILQDDLFLRFYRNILDCIGVEMEAYHFAAEIARGKENRVLKRNVAQRFLYYVSDLPLKGKPLTDESVDFDEGVPSMNACFRACFRCIFPQRRDDVHPNE